MKTFKQYINESLDSSYRFEKTETHNDPERGSLHTYEFKDHADNNIVVKIAHDTEGKTGHLSFKQDGGYDKTGKQGTKAIKIFSTVKKIVEKHKSDHPSLERIKFTSTKDKQTNRPDSRGELYKRLTNSFGGQNLMGQNINTHIIPLQRK